VHARAARQQARRNGLPLTADVLVDLVQRIAVVPRSLLLV
jgi:hypothetical protein